MGRGELVIRVRFRNCKVAEMRGTEDDCEALFDRDETPPLIDYVQALDPEHAEFAMYFHADDDRWEDIAASETDPPTLST